MPGSGSQTRARTEVVMVRLTPDEKRDAERLAARKGLSLPALFRLAMESALIGEAMNARH